MKNSSFSHLQKKFQPFELSTINFNILLKAFSSFTDCLPVAFYTNYT